MQSFNELALMVPEIIRGVLKTPLDLQKVKRPGLNRVNTVITHYITSMTK